MAEVVVAGVGIAGVGTFLVVISSLRLDEVVVEDSVVTDVVVDGVGISKWVVKFFNNTPLACSNEALLGKTVEFGSKVGMIFPEPDGRICNEM